MCVCVDCVFEKSVGFAAILLLFLLSQILPFVCFATLVVVVPNFALVFCHSFFFLGFCCCCCCSKFTTSCFATFVVVVVVVPNSPLRVLLHLLLLLLLFQIHHFVFCYICCCFCCSKFTTLCFCYICCFCCRENFLAWCFATSVVVIPNSPLCVLLHLLSQISSFGVLPLLLLLFQIHYFVFCYICCLLSWLPQIPHFVICNFCCCQFCFFFFFISVLLLRCIEISCYKKLCSIGCSSSTDYPLLLLLKMLLVCILHIAERIDRSPMQMLE